MTTNIQELSERQLEIVRATIALISEEGVHNFSIRKLARRVGVTEPAVYRHFESKDDLMIKLAFYIVQNWHEMLDELPLQKLGFVEQAKRIFSEVISYLDENRAFAKTLFSADLFSSDSGMTGILLQLKNVGLKRFGELLAQGQAAGEVRPDVDVLNVSRVFFGSVWWVVADWLSTQCTIDLVSSWSGIWDCLLELLRRR